MNRPDPDLLLAQVQAEDERAERGKLKIFLGYAAGVGKTYAMLQAAHQRQEAGVEVVIAYIETHKRAETEALVDGLEIIPRALLDYRGTHLQEMDLDGVLARKPKLALVDELAHTNAPGSRHPKRYQDVEELLEAGIDVYSTLNIQHIESLNDVVAQITGVIVRETIPDRVFDAADEIELIDLPTDELRQRLTEGKVYVPEQAGRAMHKFFRSGNLAALRELALRRAAQRVDEQMRAYMQTRAIAGPWAAGERLMVAISPHPLSERLVRAGRRMAAQMNGEWFVLYIETADHPRLPVTVRDRIQKTLRLAEELGAEVVTLPGERIAETILDYARKQNITKLIIGKPLLPRWKEFLRGGSLVDHLIRHSGAIDVYVINGDSGESKIAESTPQSIVTIHTRDWRPYAVSFGLVAIVTLLNQWTHSILEPTNVVMFYLLTVVWVALRYGRGPAVLASVLSVLFFNFFFVPPRLTFVVADVQYLFTFVVLLIVGLVVSNLTARQREQAQQAQRREQQTATLYALSRDLAAAADLEAIARAVHTHIKQLTGYDGILFFPKNGSGKVIPYQEAEFLHRNGTRAGVADSELAVAAWAFTHDQMAGKGTNTLPASSGVYYPLRGTQEKSGVLGVLMPDENMGISRDQRRLLEAFVNQVALAVERFHLVGKAQQVQVLRETEKLQTALLNSISHDLRTPLVSITGALSSLRDDNAPVDRATQRALLDNAFEEADRLNRLVGNFLELSKMEAGALRPARQVTDVQDLVGVALNQTSLRLQGREVDIHLDPNLPMVPMDFVLMNQVLVNLLENAAKYSPDGTPILIRAERHGRALQIAVADRGYGIPVAERDKIFDKFYRVDGNNDSVAGSGLGLAIAKGIVEAHGGTIQVQSRTGGGTEMVVALPLTA
jgi:two-component system sensor histidine kinase KdpD